jgi:hypothetical protein
MPWLWDGRSYVGASYSPVVTFEKIEGLAVLLDEHE